MTDQNTAREKFGCPRCGATLQGISPGSGCTVCNWPGEPFETIPKREICSTCGRMYVTLFEGECEDCINKWIVILSHLPESFVPAHIVASRFSDEELDDYSNDLERADAEIAKLKLDHLAFIQEAIHATESAITAALELRGERDDLRTRIDQALKVAERDEPELRTLRVIAKILRESASPPS